jgi:hypothetical protein
MSRVVHGTGGERRIENGLKALEGAIFVPIRAKIDGGEGAGEVEIAVLRAHSGVF